MSGHGGTTGPMLASPRCGPAPAAAAPAARRRCAAGRDAACMAARAGSGAPRANQNARKHGLFTAEAIAERRQIRALLGEARKLLDEMG